MFDHKKMQQEIAMFMSQGQRFAQTYQETQPFLNAFLRKRGVDVHDREDIIQETFLRYFKIMKQKQCLNDRSYLVAIAKNLHSNLYRSQKHLAPCSSVENIEEKPDKSFENSLFKAKTAKVASMVADLEDTTESRAFKLHYQEGFKFHEIATLTKSSMGTVASHISRFRRKFVEKAAAVFEKEDIFN